MQDFAQAAILAYECGHTEESLRQQLAGAAAKAAAAAEARALAAASSFDESLHAGDPAASILPSSPFSPAPNAAEAAAAASEAASPAGAAAGAAAPAATAPTVSGAGRPPMDVDRAVTLIGIVWLTLMLSPRGQVTRWAASAAVGGNTICRWRGFVTMIVTGWVAPA